MPFQTVTSSIEADLDPSVLFELLLDAEQISKWAPAFADTVERIGHHRYRVLKDGDAFEFELISHRPAGTVDYLREMPNGGRSGAYLRVVPRPRGGSTVTMTVPIQIDGTGDDVTRVVEGELGGLVRLAQVS